MSDAAALLAQMEREKRKWIACRSYGLFAAYYFDLQVTDFHAAMAKHWQDNRFSLTLVCMQHGKSTTMKIDIIRNICLNPNVRIILTTATKDDADEYVRAIESELTGNQKLIDDFGPFYNKNRWTSSGFRVIGCQHSNPHDTLETFGSGTWNQKGHGCEIVYVDDIVTEETCLTPEARAKQLRYFNMAVASGPRAMWSIQDGKLQVPKGIIWPMDAPYNPGGPDGEYGQVIVMGTCFDPHDLYDTLRNAPKYKLLYFDCYWDHEKWEPDKTQTKALWPEVWPIKRLNAMRYEMGWSQEDFDKRMRNIARSPSEIIFRREWFTGEEGYKGCLDESRSFGELPKEAGKALDLYKVLGFDPASGKHTVFSAYPTWQLVGVRRDGNPEEDTRYIIDAYREKCGPEEQTDITFDGGGPRTGFYAKYHYDLLKVEDNGFADLMLNSERWKRMKRMGVRIEPCTTGRNKYDPVAGVKSMEAIFRDGLVSIPYKTPEDKKLAQEIIDQFVDFSFSRSGRKRALTDYVMAFWFAELALRANRDQPKAYRAPDSPFTIRNPYWSKGQRRESGATARLASRR